MTTNDQKPVTYLIVDSSVLIRRAPLKDLTDTVYSVHGVVNEIKDANTRASLQVLPFDFKLVEPNADALKFITHFSRKTGDYSNLSAVDLDLLALSYQLCKEKYDPTEFEQLKLEPGKNLNAPVVESNQLKLDKPVTIAGFYLPNKPNDVESEQTSKLNTLVEDLKLNDENNNSNEAVDEAHQHQDEEHHDDEEENDDDDDDEGWINPSNIEEIKKANPNEMDQETIGDRKIKVACMTSDFGMQNVLIQIGIPVLSVDGLLIKKARNYVLKCIACRKVTTNMEKKFCPHCGYKTLQRVILIIDSDGNKIYKERRKPITSKGTRFSLPTPHGGKHPTYPIIMEDQPRAHNFPSRRAKIKNNPLDPDYVYQASPFTTRDVQSRASKLGIRTGESNSRFNKR